MMIKPVSFAQYFEALLIVPLLIMKIHTSRKRAFILGWEEPLVPVAQPRLRNLD
jgi:hypothetical protein